MKFRNCKLLTDIKTCQQFSVEESPTLEIEYFTQHSQKIYHLSPKLYFPIVDNIGLQETIKQLELIQYETSPLQDL